MKETSECTLLTECVLCFNCCCSHLWF